MDISIAQHIWNALHVRILVKPVKTPKYYAQVVYQGTFLTLNKKHATLTVLSGIILIFSL